MTKIFDGKTLIILFEDGFNLRGETKFTKKSFTNFAESTTIDQLNTIGNALSLLYNLTFSKLCVDEDFVLEPLVV